MNYAVEMGSGAHDIHTKFHKYMFSHFIHARAHIHILRKMKNIKIHVTSTLSRDCLQNTRLLQSLACKPKYLKITSHI
jgi:hypothetical protein